MKITNSGRGSIAGAMLAHMGSGYLEEEIHVLVTDALANIMHFCHQRGIDHNACWISAEHHFNEEVAEETT
jgi:hypothetical protein